MQRLEHGAQRVKERVAKGVKQLFPITVMAPEHFFESAQRQGASVTHVHVETQEDILVDSGPIGNWGTSARSTRFLGYRVGVSYEAQGSGRPVRYFDQSGYLPTDKRIPDPENNPDLQTMQQEALVCAVLGRQSVLEKLPGATVTVIGPQGVISPQESERLIAQTGSS